MRIIEKPKRKAFYLTALLLIGVVIGITINTKQPNKQDAINVAPVSTNQPVAQVVPTTTPPPAAAPAATVKPTAPVRQPICISKPIPPDTIYKQVDYLNEGTTSVVTGIDGFTIICDGVVKSSSPAISKIVYQGTRKPYVSPTPSTSITTTTPPGPTNEEIRQANINACVRKMQSVSPGSSAYMQCYSLY